MDLYSSRIWVQIRISIVKIHLEIHGYPFWKPSNPRGISAEPEINWRLVLPFISHPLLSHHLPPPPTESTVDSSNLIPSNEGHRSGKLPQHQHLLIEDNNEYLITWNLCIYVSQYKKLIAVLNSAELVMNNIVRHSHTLLHIKSCTNPHSNPPVVSLPASLQLSCAPNISPSPPGSTELTVDMPTLLFIHLICKHFFTLFNHSSFRWSAHASLQCTGMYMRHEIARGGQGEAVRSPDERMQISAWFDVEVGYGSVMQCCSQPAWHCWRQPSIFCNVTYEYINSWW